MQQSMRTQRKVSGSVVMLVALGLALPGCSGASGSSASQDSADKPARIEKIEGTNVSRVILKPEAARSLAIQTRPVRLRSAADQKHKVIPYAAVLHDPNGDAWVYTPVGELAFLRHRIVIERIDADRALVSDGPPAGTEVVTVGAAELYGAELGVGK